MTYRERKRYRRERKRSKMLLALLVVVICVLIGMLGLVGYVLAVSSTAPPLRNLKPVDQGTSSVVYAADGSRLGFIQSDEIRTPVRLRRIPESMRAATIAIEDERFYKHSGVDYEAIGRAAWKDIKSGETIEGGSTITQQLVRNLYVGRERTFQRKIREAKLATELEDQHSKQWILESYLNAVAYGTVDGQTAVGVQAAAQTFFSKNARDLELEESALLAGLPQAPSDLNPFQNPKGALERRNEVLKKMAKRGYITDTRAREAIRRPLGVERGDLYTRIREPFFFDYVKQQLIDEFGVNTVRKGGLKVYTTIYPKLQQAGREAIDSTLTLPTDPSSAVVAIDPRNGYIRAMASSSSYKGKQFNLAAQGHRQPGSAFKTFVLTTAVKRGVNPNTTSYVSKPLDLKTQDYGPWKVQTYDQTYGGSMNLVRATLRSDNTVFAQLDLDLGPKSVADTAKEMGITTKLDGYPAEGLGGLTRGVSPLEMANAYATLASGGIRNEPIAIKRVVFSDGDVEDLGKPKRERVLSEAVAYEVTKILKQNVLAGTGTRANIGCPSAGKTGTTDNFNDAWFVGYTPHFSVSAWVGYPNALVEMRSVHGISVAGGTFPAQIWNKFMQVAKGRNCEDFERPTAPMQWSSFFGKYSTTGSYAGTQSYNYGRGTDGGYGGDTSGGGYRGYDPRLYERPPSQGKPDKPKKEKGNGKGPKGNFDDDGGSGPARPAALAALAALALIYAALAVPVAAPGSAVVLATAERSPDWLLGPWQVFGASGADGELAGPLFYAGLWLAMVAYVVVLASARAIGPKLAIGSIVAFHVLFLLAPPLLSQDVFSYISYARLDVVHSLSPYTHSPDAVPSDAAFAFAGSKNASSVYGPIFTLATYPLAKLSVPVAFWTLKSVVALASLGIVALAWGCAQRLGRDPVFVGLVIGLNPLVLVHVVGGAHNDALVVLLLLGAVLAALSAAQTPAAESARERLSGFLSALAVGIKVSAGLVLPFLVLGVRRKAPLIAGAVLAALGIVAVSLIAFGGDALDALGLIGENQERTSRWSLPQRSADGIGGLIGASPSSVIDFTRAAFGLAFVFGLGLLLYRTWKAPAGSSYWLTATGWATLGLLVASAWLVPWYAIWLLPLAALSASRPLLIASLTLCAYMLVIAVPL